MSIDKNVLVNVYGLLQKFIYSYFSSKEVLVNLNKFGNSKEFWIYVNDSELMMATSYWCMVFGTDNNEVHWKKLGLNNDDFKKQLLSNLKISEKEWKEYWGKMVEFRNNFVAHRHVVNFRKPVPFFDLALKAIYFLDDYIRKNYSINHETFKQYSNRCKTDIKNIVRDLLQ